MKARVVLAAVLVAGCGSKNGGGVDAPTAVDAGDDGGDTDAPTDAGACPSRTGITGGTGQVLVIQSADFIGDTLVIRNIGTSAVTFAPDSNFAQPNWRVYVDTQATGHDLPANFPLAAGATVRIHLRDAGTDDAGNIYLAWTALGANLRPDTASDGMEAAILAPNNGNSDPAAMRAYVRWGGDDSVGPSRTLRGEAAAAGMWIGDNPGDFVFVFEADAGITIGSDGDATDPADWTNSAPPACL